MAETRCRSLGETAAPGQLGVVWSPQGLIRRGFDSHEVDLMMLRAAFIKAAVDAGVPLRDVQIAARHADRRTTTI